MSRALFIRGAHDAYVAPFNLREGREGEVLIDVASVGLCGSDLHYYKDGGIGSAVVKEPFVPGTSSEVISARTLTNSHWRAGRSLPSIRTRPAGIANFASAVTPTFAPMWNSLARRLSTGR